MPETPQPAELCLCICHMGPRPRGVLHSRACCPNWNGDLDGPAGDSLPHIEVRARRDERERAEKAEAEREEEYQRAERLHEETSLLLGRAHNAERKLDRANEALMRVRGVLHEGRSDAETLAIIRRAIAGPLSERDRDLEEARRARETADLHWGRAEQRAEAAEEALDASRTALDRVIALARSLADTDPEMADLIAETIVGVPGEGEPGAALALLNLEPGRG